MICATCLFTHFQRDPGGRLIPHISLYGNLVTFLQIAHVAIIAE